MKFRDRPLIDSKDRLLVGLLGLLIVLCLACDFFMVPILAMVQGRPTIPGFPLLLSVVGRVLAQGNLIAAWLNWGD